MASYYLHSECIFGDDKPILGVVEQKEGFARTQAGDEKLSDILGFEVDDRFFSLVMKDGLTKEKIDEMIEPDHGKGDFEHWSRRIIGRLTMGIKEKSHGVQVKK